MIQELDDVVLKVFNETPKPDMPGYTSWHLTKDSSGILRPERDSTQVYDCYVLWIICRNLDTTPRRRCAVGIRWTADELEPGTITAKIQRAIREFPSLAQEFEEGGVLPAPVIV